VVDSNGQLGVSTTSPNGAVKTAYAQKILKEMRQQAAQIRDLNQQVAELKDLKQELRAVLLKLQAKEELIAQR
jgi:t-SNARE complex subunit (syntaxin)